MNKFTQIIVFGLAIFVFIILSLNAFAIKHESAHGEICRLFDGEVKQKVINLLGDSFVICSVNQTQEYKLAQSNVDAFGYQIRVVLSAFWLGVFLIGMIMILKGDENE